MIFVGHQILSFPVPVVRSFFILWKMLLSSWNLPSDHLLICTNITFQYPKKWHCFVPFSSCCDPISTSPVPKSHIIMSHNSSDYNKKLPSPVPKKHLIQSPNLSWYDLISNCPVPKHHLVKSKKCIFMTISQLLLFPKVNLFCPIFHLVMAQCQLLLSQKVTTFCPIICLVMTLYQLLISQKVTLFVLFYISSWPNINFSCPQSHIVLFHHSSGYDLISTSPVQSS